jgi:hypothetical protein
MKIPRVLVGTLYSGENEFDELVESVKKQRNVMVEHLVIKNLSEYEAHKLLYSFWNEHKHEYDYFLKLDADIVLTDQNKLFYTYLILQWDKNITGMQVALHDFYTDKSLNGVGIFTPQVYFEIDDNEKSLRCDRGDKGHNIKLSSDFTKEINLYPYGIHGKNPNKYQLFRFGAYRMKKAQYEVLKDCYLAHKKYSEIDNRRLFCLYGAYLYDKLDIVDYNNKDFIEYVNKLEFDEKMTEKVYKMFETFT